jgi:hypothetical protein
VKFEKLVNWKIALPLFRAAREGVSFLTPAIKLLAWLFKHAPGVSLFDEDEDQEEDVARNECAKKIAVLAGGEIEVTPMTTCKQLQQLRGMIDQHSPPTIYPYATQLEIYRGFKNSVWKSARRRTSSFVSRGSGRIARSRSLVWQIEQGGKGLDGLNLTVLEKRPILKKQLEIEGAGKNSLYVLSTDEFASISF